MLRSALKIVLAALLTCTAFSGVAVANDIHISGIVAFSSMDGSSDDHDGVANGVFTVDDGNLVIDGTIQCNDGPPLPGNAGACPIRISVSGDLVLEAGGAIVAENRTGGGSGANINLEVGGDLILHGPSGALPGAVVSSGSITGSGAAGSMSASIDGAVNLEAGSTLSASAAGGSAGAIGIEAGGGIRIAGLVASGPGTSLLASRWSGAVLGGGSNNQSGGTILLRSTSADEPGIRIEATGTVVSQGQSSGPQFVLLEACGIEVHGLVAAVSKNDSPARVALRSGKGILVDGRDLAGGSGSHLGRVRADSIEAGAATHLVDLFAEADIQIFGPTSGTTDLFTVSANPGTQTQRTGGSISSVSIAGALAASGNAFDAGRALSGNKGGKIDLRSAGDVDLADAHLRAVGGYLAASGSRRGGQISVRSYSGEIRWTFGTGDVRPTGSGTTAASRGTIKLTACSGIDTTGTTFPVLGSPVAPFPVEADGVCSPAAPFLPSGEPPLPVCNVPPTAVNDAATVNEDSSNNAIDVLANDTDTDGGPKSVASVTQPVNGAVSITGGGTGVSYTPNANYCNNPPGTTPDTFTYTLNGGSSATVSVTVTCADDDPAAVDDAATVTEDSSNNAIDVLANDTDADGGPKSVASVTQPSNGSVSITGGGTGVSYTPNASYCNNPPGTTPDTFTYTLNGDSTATVSVTVTCADDDPAAVNDAATVSEDSSNNAIDVLANDTDVDGGPKSVASVTQPSNGSVSITGGGSGVSYTPNANYCNSVSGAPDTFNYTLSPGGSSAAVSVTVSCVDDPPTAVIDTATVSEDSGANTINVQANDADVDGGTNTISGVTQPANGTVVITNGGLNLTYAPNANYCNSVSGTPDTFSYILTPGGSTATVSVTVTCVNDGPVVDLDANNDKGTAGSDFATTFTEGNPATLIEDPVDSTLTDIDSTEIASLTVTITNLLDTGNETLSADVTETEITANYVTDATTGVLTLTGPDTLANFETVLRKVRYLNSDTSPDTTPRVIHFVANDGTDNGNTAISTVTIVEVDTSPTAVNDSETVNEDSGANAIDVLANDTDSDGGPISVASVTQPANGTASITGGGTGVSYTPNANYCNSVSGTPDMFTYTLSPGGSSATVSVTVTCVDDNPTAVNDTATVVEDSGANAIDVLANDTDADGGAKSVASVTQPSNGVVLITGGGTGVSYTPNANYCNNPPGTTPDTFTYTLSPGGSISTVSVTVTCVDDNPAAVNDAATVVEDSSGNAIDVLANDTDVDGGAKSVMSVTQPVNGAVVITGGGTGVSYTPNANYCGADSFTYTLTPGGSSATVSVTVTCVDDPPVAVNDAATLNEDDPATAISVLANDTDVDGGTKVITSAASATHGTVVLTGGSPGMHTGLTYEPGDNYCGPDSFTYTLNGGSSATVSVTVNCVNDPPVAVDDIFDTIGNTELRVDLAAALTPHVLETTGGTPFGVLDGSPLPDHDPVENNAITLTGIVGCGDITAPFGDSPACNTANGGTVILEANGSFSYKPAAGHAAASDSFQYTIQDNGVPSPASDTGLVTINRFERVWYVDPTFGVGGNGTSALPFNSLDFLDGISGASDSDVAGDYIFIHDGTLALSAPMPMENNQRLIGQGHVAVTTPSNFALSIPVNVNGNGSPTNLVLSGVRPQLTNATGDAVVITTAIPVEIVGLSLASTTGNAIDLTSAAALTGSGTFTIGNNELRGAGAEGIDVNLNVGTTGTLTLNVTGNSWDLAGTHTGNAVDINRAAGTLNINFNGNTNIVSSANNAVVIASTVLGSLNVTGFSGNSVHGNNALAGISMSQVTFDSNLGTGGFQQVDGDNLTIGDSGNVVGGAGMSLGTVQGNLFLDNLYIYAGTSGLTLSGSGGMTFAVTPAAPAGSGMSVIRASNGAAVDITSATIDLRLADMDSTTSGAGVSLSSVGGTFSTDPDASISKTSGGGTAFSVASSSATVTYAGTLNVTSGSGVSLTSNSGSMSFSGGMTLSTGANAGFTATGGGTVTVTDPAGLTNNTITTTSGRPLQVENTNIGANGLTFERIVSTGAPNGIRLSNTGASGFLTVTGAGSDDSGGSITNSTQDGVFLSSTRNITLNEMVINSSTQSHIEASSVVGLTLNGIETDLSTDHGILGSSITNLTIGGGTFHRGGAGSEPTCNKDGVNITNLLGTSSVTGATFSRSNTRQFYVTNTTTSGAPDTLMISGTTWNTHTGPCSGDHLSVAADTGGNFKIITNGNSGENNFSTGGIGIQAAANGSGTMQAIITGVETSGNTAGVAISGTANGNISFNVHDNRAALGTGFSGTGSVALITTCTTTGTCQGAFTGNSITHTAGTSTNAMQVVVEGNGTGRVTVANNTVSGNFQRGFHGQSRSGTGTLSLHVTGNNFTATDTAGLQVMNFEVGASGGGTTNSLCLNLATNTATPAGGMSAYRLLHRTGYTYQLQNLAQASTTNTVDVQTWVTTTKTNVGTPVSVTVGSTAFTTSAGCSTPTLPTP